MGRRAEGWKLEWTRGKFGYVRFTHAKVRHLVSTGQSDPRKASEEAARIYARVVAGGAARPASTRALLNRPLIELFAEWLSTLEGSLDVETIRTYETTYVGKHWPAHFRSVEEMCSEVARERYRSARLKVATSQTVKKETWVADKFLRWCKKNKVIAATPPALEWDNEMGTRTGKQRKHARELDAAQVEAFLVELPTWFEVGKRAHKKKPFPIRDRFVFGYETGLRPATLSELVWSDWKGATLLIRSEVDKIRFGREVPLSARAQEALERTIHGALARGVPNLPGDLIFGDHEYLKSIAGAAKRAGLDGVAPYDLRHARATHLADAGAAITGIGYLVGHKQMTTTNRYLHTSEKAAKLALETTAKRVSEVPSPESPQEGRVTDGARTRDIWSHKAPGSPPEHEKTSIVGPEPSPKPTDRNRSEPEIAGKSPGIDPDLAAWLLEPCRAALAALQGGRVPSSIEVST